MEINSKAVDKTEETTEESQDSSKSTSFENIKNIIADKLHNVADAIGEKTADLDGQSGIVQCGKHASEWLDLSAEYIRQFDCKQADANVREYVKQNPGHSLLMAGAVGLIIGAILRRR